MSDPGKRAHDSSSSGYYATDPSTDDLELATLQESGLTQTYDTAEREGLLEDQNAADLLEADVILIAHPENRRLGTRFRLSPGGRMDVGRSMSAEIPLPEVLSISRQHARLEYRGRRVTIRDLGSTNGTYVNGELIEGPAVLHSGDRFQVAGVHFKFLHERDPEHAYYETIYDLVTRDGLTEIYNKRKYEEEVAREFARAKRHKRPLALIMFDIDDFKQINDSYGHLCGDFILKQVTGLARELLRPEQIFARVGGDEFVILTPETDAASGEVLARKLCERVSSLDYTYCDFVVRVTCSFGVAELRRGMKDPNDLYHAADQALISAKRAGRNRVVMSGDAVDA
jgi:diguanylate cyclase (GGDEF)-like protein